MFVRIEPAHMDVIELGINSTPARAAFKKNAGQNNHFLITVLVGLDSVREGKAVLNEEFSTSWSPKDTSRSALRSRDYVLVTSLAWIADLVDVYRKQIQAMDSAFDDSLSAKIEKLDGRDSRLSGVARELGIPRNNPSLLMMRFAIKWRNTIVHSDAANRLDSQLRADLIASADALSEAHRGLSIERSITSFSHGSAPTFKEAASFISAAQNLVKILDEATLSKMDVDKYAESTLITYFSESFAHNSQIFSQYWPTSAAKSRGRLIKVLEQHGFTPENSRATLSHSYLESISDLTASGARTRFLSMRPR